MPTGEPNLTKIPPILSIPRTRLTPDIIEGLLKSVHYGGGEWRVHFDHMMGQVELELRLSPRDSMDLLQANGGIRNAGGLYTTDNTGPIRPFAPIQYPPNPTAPNVPGDTVVFPFTGPNEIPEALKRELMAMRQNGEDCEAVIRRLIRFAEAMKDLLDQARTGGMNV
jgi:hypothetical protein